MKLTIGKHAFHLSEASTYSSTKLEASSTNIPLLSTLNAKQKVAAFFSHPCQFNTIKKINQCINTSRTQISATYHIGHSAHAFRDLPPSYESHHFLQSDVEPVLTSFKRTTDKELQWLSQAASAFSTYSPLF
ncbi:MAG: hypothetical protein ACPGUD_02205 [Parashewanella sp.]